MINTITTIPCPVCNKTIEIDTYRLLQGEQFVCKADGCNAVIALSKDNKDNGHDTMNKLDDLTSKLDDLKNRKNKD